MSRGGRKFLADEFACGKRNKPLAFPVDSDTIQSVLDTNTLIRKALRKSDSVDQFESKIAVELIDRIKGHMQFIFKTKAQKGRAKDTAESIGWLDRDKRFLDHFVSTGVVPRKSNDFCGLSAEWNPNGGPTIFGD